MFNIIKEKLDLSPDLKKKIDWAKNYTSIPITIEKEEKINHLVQDNISISKADWDSHETSWDFKRNPLYEQFLLCMEDDLQNVVSSPNPLEKLLQYDVSEAKHPLSTCIRNYTDTWET